MYWKLLALLPRFGAMGFSPSSVVGGKPTRRRRLHLNLVSPYQEREQTLCLLCDGQSVLAFAKRGYILGMSASQRSSIASVISVIRKGLLNPFTTDGTGVKSASAIAWRVRTNAYTQELAERCRHDVPA